MATIGLRSQTRRQWLVMYLILSLSTLDSVALAPLFARRTVSDSTNPYWSDEELYVDDEYYREEQNVATVRDTFEWERCNTDYGTAHVLLPPLQVERPTCIVHFCGGTFFGSAPNLWYRQLMEDLVKHTQCAVVATSIPVTLLQSPLEHVRLGRQLQQQLQVVFRDVLEDEYDTLQGIPLCGVGHSLGARLMTVLATLDNNEKVKLPPYKAFCLMSFTNHCAAASIPGLMQLHRESRRTESQLDRNKKSDITDDYSDYRGDDDEGDDEELGELFDDLQDAIMEQATRLKKALTPSSHELEFYPSPDQLWAALENGRYKIPQTLVVQFDDDLVDQSSKVATIIKDQSNVKFARLRGVHLTPISPQGVESKAMKQVNSRIGRALWKLLSGRTQSKSNEESFRELRQSIARYITEIVTKD